MSAAHGGAHPRLRPNVFRDTWCGEVLADLVGVIGYSYGASVGLVTIVLVASAVFPLIAVALSVIYLGERPVANQYVGVVLVAGGALALAWLLGIPRMLGEVGALGAIAAYVLAVGAQRAAAAATRHDDPTRAIDSAVA